MRILLVSYFYEYDFGGAEIVARELRRLCGDSGIRVDALCLAGGSNVQAPCVYRAPLPGWLTGRPQAMKRSLIFLNNQWIDRAIAHAVRDLDLRLKDYDLVHFHDTFSIPMLAQSTGFDQVRKGLTMHDNFPRRVFPNLAGLATPLLRASVRMRDRQLPRQLNHFDWIACVSRHIENQVRASIESAGPHVTTVYNPCSMKADDSSAHEPTQARFLYVGRLTREKGVDLLLEAFRGLEIDERLDVLGLEGPLSSMAAQWPDHRVRLLPPASHAEVGRMMRRREILCCPSIWEEPFGLTVLEGRVNQRVLVVTDRGGIPEIVEGYPRAVVIKTGGKSRSALILELRKALLDAMKLRDAPLDISKEQQFLRRFSPEHFFQRYQALYTSAVKGKDHESE